MTPDGDYKHKNPSVDSTDWAIAYTNVCRRFVTFKCTTVPYQPERLFQTRIFTGGLEPCGGGTGVVGGVLEGWKVTGTREGAYKIEPTNVQVICLGDSATFYAKGTGLDEESSWVSAPSLGTLANGISVTVTSTVPNTYYITGASLTSPYPSDTAVLTILKVEIEVNDTADEDDDVVCRYSTDPAGRPTIPCRARIQGLGTGSATVVLTGSKVRFSGESDTTKTLNFSCKARKNVIPKRDEIRTPREGIRLRSKATADKLRPTIIRDLSRVVVGPVPSPGDLSRLVRTLCWS